MTLLAQRARYLLLVPLLAVAGVLSGCSTISGAKSDADSVKPTGVGPTLDKSTPFLIEHGKLIGTIIALLVIMGFCKWLWGNTGIRIVGAMILVGVLVYYVMSH